MEAELTISRLGRQGEGVATHGGHPVYVPYTLPGERLIADIDDNRGVATRLLERSPARTEPFCEHFGACGGCAVQHVRQHEYIQWKHDLVAGALRREGIVTEVRDLVLAHGDGRRRATLHGRSAGSGFNAARSHKIHPLDACPILAPGLARAPQIVNDIFKAVGDCDATLTATASGIDCAVKAQKHAQGAKLVAVAEKFNLARISMNGEIIVSRNSPELTMGPVRVTLAPGCFLQATARGEETLAQLVSGSVGKAKSIADLFCGLGPFGLRLAVAAKVHGFDNDAAAVAALMNGVRNTQGIKPVTADVRDLMREPLTAAELNAYDAVIFDPPRAGAEAQSRQLAKSRVARVVAVSCDPATFARDARILVAGGYRFEHATPVDQFAWSAHVEIVGVFRR
jgi:23S rRNA (uracil1939-C5)-methyltransferase